MTKTLEKPATKSATPKAKTPFLEESGKGRGCLGNPRWQTPPSLPSRERCQRDVTREEREDAEAIIAEYREHEQTCSANDIGARRHELDERNEFRRLTDVRKQELHRELLACDHEKFLDSQHQLGELRGEAEVLARKILTKLVASFDAELQEVALAAEARLPEAGIPLCNQGDWELWRMNEVTWRHSWREVTRHKLQQLDHSASDISIGAIQWLCTSEEGTPFHWL